MRIGVDARVLMDRNYSGISEYTANLLSEILSLDASNQYSLFYNNRRSQLERLSNWKKENTIISGTKYPNKIFNYICQRLLHRPQLDIFLKGTDIFFAPHFNFISVSDKTKLVVTVHDISFLRYPYFFSRRKNFWHRSLKLAKLLQRADKIVAVSNNTKQDLIEVLNLPENKIKVIYSGNNYLLAHKDSNSISNREVLSKFNLTPGYILFVGTIEPRKNITGIIKAYESLLNRCPEFKNKQLILVGAKGWRHQPIFKQWQRSLYHQQIKFLGYVKAEEKLVLYREASVFVYPSFYEGFGFPPLEAMSCNLPVVSANVSSLPEVCGNGALLVNPYNSEEISRALELILSDNDLRRRLIKAGREKASSFSWEQTARQYLDLFQELHEEGK